MTYQWVQAKGQLLRDGKVIATGYAGAPGHINRTESEGLKNKGPLPRGWYRIWFIYPTHPKYGSHLCILRPDPGTEMFGRSGFMIHADAPSRPGTASNGCIVLDAATRKRFNVGDRIEVI